jgi:hypothetical protein
MSHSNLTRSRMLELYGLEFYMLSRRYPGIEPDTIAPRGLTGPLRGMADRNAAADAAGYSYWLHNDPNEGHTHCQTGSPIRHVDAAYGECVECRTLRLGDAQ